MTSILWSNLAQRTFKSELEKKNQTPQKFLIFQEMELSSSNIQKFQGTETSKKIP